MKKSTTLIVLLTSLLSVSVFADPQAKRSAKPTQADKATAVMKASFKDRGQAKLSRLEQDRAMALCTEYAVKPLPKKLTAEIEAENMKAIPFPADGKFMGDWKSGERIAQSGVGMQFSDNPANPAGGNCYACHKLDPKELSYGTIGVSLYQFGKLRGYTPEIAKYAYGKIYNAQAYSACSNMPRFGHNKILTEAQIKDLVALLMDPESPVNKN
jgi:L-cysteine S-thiosulfotransferase